MWELTPHTIIECHFVTPFVVYFDPTHSLFVCSPYARHQCNSILSRNVDLFAPLVYGCNQCCNFRCNLLETQCSQGTWQMTLFFDMIHYLHMIVALCSIST